MTTPDPLLPNPELLALIPDSLTAARIMRLHPILRISAVDSVLDAIERMSGKNSLRVTYSLRSFDEQNMLYAKGRTAPGNIVTKAKGGQSYHNYGLALDFVLRHPDGKVSYSLTEDLDADGVHDWNEVAEAFKRHGWEWGGEWNSIKDNPHVERIPESIAIEAKSRGVRPWKVLLEMHDAKQVDESGYVLLPNFRADQAKAEETR